MLRLRFPFTRTRKGWLIGTRWFMIRFYPPTMPRLDLWWR